MQSFWRNENKRLTKSPKLYFYDVGLASWLLRIRNTNDMEMHSIRGSLFENMIIVEAMKNRFNYGKDNNLFFYRDNKKNEVDLIFDEGAKIAPIEIKSSATFDPSFAKAFPLLESFNPRLKAVVLGSELSQKRTNLDVVSWRDFPGYLKENGYLEN